MESTVKAYKGMGMEGGIARWYEKTTRKGMDDFVKLANQIAAGLAPGAEVLEIAPGPGFLSIELAKRGLKVRAIDISKTFVEIVAKNAAAESVTVAVQQGDAAALPVPDAGVDFVVCRAAFKNFTQPVKALKEMRRVLRPGGVALLIDMRRDASVEELQSYVDTLGVNWWNRKFMMLTFKHMLIKRAYPMDEIRKMMAVAGWTAPHIELTPVGFEARIKK